MIQKLRRCSPSLNVICRSLLSFAQNDFLLVTTSDVLIFLFSLVTGLNLKALMFLISWMKSNEVLDADSSNSNMSHKELLAKVNHLTERWLSNGTNKGFLNNWLSIVPATLK